MPFRRSSKPGSGQPAFEASLPAGNPNNRAGARPDQDAAAAGLRLSDMVRFHTKDAIPKPKFIETRDGKLQTNCPTVDHTDKNPSFQITDTMGHYGSYRCWSCGVHGGGEDFARKIMGMGSWQDAVNAYVAANANGRDTGEPVNPSQRRTATAAAAGRIMTLRNRSKPALPPPVSEEDYLYRMSLLHDLQQNMETVSEWFQDRLYNEKIVDGMSKVPLNREAQKYLHSRGLWKPDPAFKVGYFPSARSSYTKYFKNKDLFREISISRENLLTDLNYLNGRIIFPWCDDYGNVLGFAGRWIGKTPEGKSKYMNSRNTEIFKKSDYLWGLHLAKDAIRQSGELLIVEGYTDVMSLHKAGIKQTVSPIGIAISQRQLEKIFKLTDRVVVCLDGDKAGQKASVDVAKKTLAYLKETGLAGKGKSMSFALLPDGKDPDEFLRDHGVDAFRRAISNPLSLDDMIKDGENALLRQEAERQERGDGIAAGNGTVTQNAEGSRNTMKRSLPDPDAEERERIERRPRAGLDR